MGINLDISKWIRFRSHARIRRIGRSRSPLLLTCLSAASMRLSVGLMLIASGATFGKDEWNLGRDMNVTSIDYKSPGCSGAWPTEKLDKWLKEDEYWIPKRSEVPFSMDANRETWLSEKEYEEIEVESLKGEIGKRGALHFSSFNQDQLVRTNQIAWMDIDGDLQCDFIGWNFSYDGIGARGEQGGTKYYVFLQRESGFKLIDYSDNSSSRWAGSQQPNAILPVWAKGHSRPFLVARSNLSFISGVNIGVTEKLDHEEIEVRSLLRWDPKRGRWETFEDQEGRKLALVITEFIKQNRPPRSAGCVKTPLPCVLPR